MPTKSITYLKSIFLKEQKKNLAVKSLKDSIRLVVVKDNNFYNILGEN